MQRAPLAARSRVILGTIVAILGACSKFHANLKEVGPVRGAVVWIRGVNILMVSDQPLLPTYLTDTVIVRADSSTPTRRGGRRVRLADLRPGDRIAVWFPGTIMESRPPQIGALRIEIE
jgi:hypothetical protein